MKFIQIADVHLGVKPDAGKPWSERRAEDIWSSFAGVVRLAAKEEADLLLIAGDLFHRQPLKRELKEVAALFGELKNTQIVLAAGNHDYMHPKSYYRSFVWPEHVHFIAGEDLEPVYLSSLDVTVWGSSYWGPEDKRHIYQTGKLDGRGLQILLGHGGDEKHHPFTLTELQEAGYDYAAFGHIHIPQKLKDHKVIMSGSLEPTDCNDFGPHGYWMGELYKDSCQVQFYPVKNCEYVKTTVEITPDMGQRQMIEAAREQLSAREAFQISHLILSGRRDADMEVPVEELQQLPRVVKVLDMTGADYCFEKLKEDYSGTLLAAFIEYMEGVSDQRLKEDALYYGVQAMFEAMNE
ncbi:Nuclease sbcCD subunit D [uncultured Roseburia sp.]|uniref:DNA repair exonuclease n=1 Tax=Brotonthovivens ammoniilytica TaxID=2981725 RepID=A0ABT2TJT9_9FIRM|nr:DNA repair exonuclease [Brotonthovivens ammoniilytica]MCU6761789.1 DNA repair exonuclease [Brotonthovivens ammoniilytica]SCI46738.1 Nuclease sbcCD subunit D [uncultured Roseburia sp.]